MARVKVILPRPDFDPPRKKVAAYARVSSKSIEHSLSTQISYYSEYIQSHPDWEYAGVYADDGISGTSTKNREKFNKMIDACRAGKIDLVLTKSISRFARNTVDTLKAVRELKALGVEVYFEKERISSLSGDGELMLSIMASFAQEESYSISNNYKWAIRKGYEQGRPHVTRRVLGYKWKEDHYEIVPEEAAVVRYVFEEYLAGSSLGKITKELREQGIKNHTGELINEKTLFDTIRNEIYTGCLILQKKYAPDGRPRKSVRNKGQLPKYRIDGAHEAIISDVLFNRVQDAIEARRGNTRNQFIHPTIYSGRVICGLCGAHCGRMDQHSVSVGKRINIKVWKCRKRRLEGKEACSLKNIHEDELIRITKEAFDIDEINIYGTNTLFDSVAIYPDQVIFNTRKGTLCIERRSNGKKDN
ncbi:MAG: recombinase family protein [Candidatus Weimeria sp.]